MTHPGFISGNNVNQKRVVLIPKLSQITHLQTFQFLLRGKKARIQPVAYFPKPQLVCNNKESTTLTYYDLVCNPQEVVNTRNFIFWILVRALRSCLSFSTLHKLLLQANIRGFQSISSLNCFRQSPEALG